MSGDPFVPPDLQVPASYDTSSFRWVRQSEHDRGLDAVLFRTAKSSPERAWPVPLERCSA